MVKYNTKLTENSFGVSRKCNAANHLTPKIGMYLFDLYVSPVLNYACEWWSNLKETV